MADETHEGHRKRLRQRYIDNGLNAFADHEVLELLLTYSIPRKDCNELAHRVLNRFGSFSGVTEASVQQLCTVEGISENSAVLLHMVGDLSGRYLASKTQARPKLNNIKQLHQYITALYQGERNEVFYLLCLDAHCKLIRNVELARGTIDAVTVYPRNVVESALSNQAHSVVLTHNHPGGDCSPSQQDNEVTRAVTAALRAIDIRIYDHIIYSVNGLYSYNHACMLGSCAAREERSAAEKRG